MYGRYTFDIPVDVSSSNLIIDTKPNQITNNNGQYRLFNSSSEFPYQFTASRYLTVTLNSYTYTSNNKIRIRNNYLYNNYLYPYTSNDVYTDVILSQDTNVLNLSVSIPLILNNLIYNFYPNLQLNNIFGLYRLKYNPNLYSTFTQKYLDNLNLYMNKHNISLGVILYQKYFNKTIFKQALNIVPQRCVFNHSIIYGNNDIIVPTIIRFSDNISILNNSILTSIITLENISALLNDINTLVLYNLPEISAAFNNLENTTIQYIYNIYLTNRSVYDTIQATNSICISTINYSIYNSIEDSDILVFNINPNKLVTLNSNNKKETRINVI